MAPHKNRNVCAQADANGSQLVQAQAKPPEMVQGQQGRGGVGTAATDSAPHGETLFQMNVGPQATVGLLLEHSGGPHHQIGFGREAGKLGGQFNGGVGTCLEAEFIPVIQNLEQGLKLVVAVGTASGNVKQQVQFGRS